LSLSLFAPASADFNTGDQFRFLKVGDRVYWKADKNDQGTVVEKNWAGVTIR
jgi:hypothetical protein